VSTAGADKVVATVYGGGFRIAVPVVRLDNSRSVGPTPTALPRPSPVVHECLQTARELLGRRGFQDMVSATLAVRRGLRIDPRSVDSWILLAQISMLRVNRGQADSREIVLRRARRALRHALAIAPDTCEALAELGWITAAIDGQTTDGLVLLDRALALDDSNWFAHMCRAWALHAARRPEEGLAEFEAMMRCNPLSTFSTGSYGYALGCSGRIREAFAVLDRGIRQMPMVDSLLSARSSVAAMAGDLDRALVDARACAKLAPDVPNQLYALAYALAVRGEVDEAQKLFDRMTRARGWLSPSWLAIVLAGLGERSAAADALRRAARQGCTWLSFVQYDPPAARHRTCGIRRTRATGSAVGEHRAHRIRSAFDRVASMSDACGWTSESCGCCPPMY
jgi:tetratricopeptide (TPR) repeat protein